MDSELKPCPFCGSTKLLVKQWKYHSDVICLSCYLRIQGREGIVNLISNWQSRPIEDALRATIAAQQVKIAELKRMNEGNTLNPGVIGG